MVADREASENESTARREHYEALVRRLRQTGASLRSDEHQPRVGSKPDWLDEKLFYQARSVYERHFMGINFAHLSGLLLLVRVDSIYRTLSATGESDSVKKLFKRYFNTIKHVKSWYEGDIFAEGSDAYKSLLIVRGMHNKVSSRFNRDTKGAHQGHARSPSEAQPSRTSQQLDDEAKMVHISEYDIMITQFAFVGFIVTNPQHMGLLANFGSQDLASLLHFWRVIGYYLGASDTFNLCAYSMEDTVGLCRAITQLEYKDSLTKNPLESSQGIMSLNIVRSIKFIPMLTIYGITTYLYELLGHDNKEVESRRTWYSNLSYTLIKLVMTRLLAYRPLRSFNNGLTRLSLYLVGKVENWFSDRLESKYGAELKL